MHAPPRPRPGQNLPKPSPARITSLARLWLACIATLLTCAAHLLPPALQRRLRVLDLPRRLLARVVANLILLCAIERATPPAHSSTPQAGAMRALLRTGVHRHLVNANGEFDLARIAGACANPEAAIADMVAALETGLTRRSPILPRTAYDALPALAPNMIACASDTS